MITFSPVERIKRDTNEELLKLKGELTDEQAMATFADFLFHNPGFCLELLAGIRLYPIQEIFLRGWMTSNYNMAIWGRGLSKSWSCAAFCLFWALFNPNARIVIISFAFRASRRILEQIEKFVNDADAKLLKNCFPKDMNRKNDEWKWVLPNGASILCVPLGDASKLRGIRAEVLICDEFGYISSNVVNEVLTPFLVSNNNIKEQLKIRERENKLIAEGKMTEAEREKFTSDIKVIYLSSATYQFEDMYKTYCDWIKNSSRDDMLSSYFVSRLSYEAAPPGLVNEKTIEEAKNGQTSESVFKREYCAIFTADSDSYFSAKKMADCTFKDGEFPCIEITGDKDGEYVIGIDPSFSSAEYSDYFAICVGKLVKKGDKVVPLVVHNYMVPGGNLQDHHLYLYFLLKNFNVVYIAIDSSQGDNEFITSANNSKLFKDNNITLLEIEADFKKDDQSETPAQIKASHNKTIGRIVQKQPFTSSFQKAANEYLQGCFDYKRIFFASKITANESAAVKEMDTDISVLSNHAFYKEMTINQFLEWQDVLIDKLKQQCAMIEYSSSALGTPSWDLPITFRRSKNPDRMRKDGYSALLLMNYACKLFLASREVIQEDTPDTFIPFAL